MSFKNKLIRIVVKKALKKYTGNEQEYITKRMKGQAFEKGQMRESSYVAPEGYCFERQYINGVNLEHLFKEGVKPTKVIYVLHGGAYHMAMDDMYGEVMRLYSDDGRYDVYALDYRVAPKDPYPAAVDDAVAGFYVLLSKGYKAKDIIVAGDSAGGNLALAMTLKLREMGEVFPLTYVLSSPWVDLSETFSPEVKKSDVLFGWGNALEICAEEYANGQDLKNPLISPVFGDYTGFQGVNVYISVSKGEMLENSGIRLAESLKKYGASVHLDVLDSGMHDIIIMHATKMKEVKDAWNRIHSYLRVRCGFR